MTTVLTISKEPLRRGAVGRALAEAGVGVVEVETWEAAAKAMTDIRIDLVICDAAILESPASPDFARAVSSLLRNDTSHAPSVPSEVARSLSHDLRTPLSAMAGWLHLMESGTLDEAGLRRAIGKLRVNLEDQVRTIERHLGSSIPGHA